MGVSCTPFQHFPQKPLDFEFFTAMIRLSLLSAMFHKIDYPFLIGAFVSFVASVSLWFLVSHDYGLFVGIWVPSILSLWVGVRVVILSAGIQTRKGS